MIDLVFDSGENLAERGAQETSSVVVETVHKVSKAHKGGGVVLPHFKSNASMVTSKGMGLKKAYMGKQNLFNINASDAGRSFVSSLLQTKNNALTNNKSKYNVYK